MADLIKNTLANVLRWMVKWLDGDASDDAVAADSTPSKRLGGLGALSAPLGVEDVARVASLLLLDLKREESRAILCRDAPSLVDLCAAVLGCDPTPIVTYWRDGKSAIDVAPHVHPDEFKLLANTVRERALLAKEAALAGKLIVASHPPYSHLPPAMVFCEPSRFFAWAEHRSDLFVAATVTTLCELLPVREPAACSVASPKIKLVPDSSISARNAEWAHRLQTLADEHATRNHSRLCELLQAELAKRGEHHTVASIRRRTAGVLGR